MFNAIDCSLKNPCRKQILIPGHVGISSGKRGGVGQFVDQIRVGDGRCSVVEGKPPGILYSLAPEDHGAELHAALLVHRKHRSQIDHVGLQLK